MDFDEIDDSDKIFIISPSVITVSLETIYIFLLQ